MFFYQNDSEAGGDNLVRPNESLYEISSHEANTSREEASQNQDKHVDVKLIKDTLAEDIFKVFILVRDLKACSLKI